MNKPGSSGFTLLEAMTALAIVSIGLAMGLPTLQALRERWAIAETMHGLSAALAKARLTAAVESVPVSVCPSADGLTCRSDLVWEAGWIVYRDPDRLPGPALPEDIIWVELKSAHVLAVRSSAGRHRIRFQPTGFAGGNNASLRICTRRAPRMVASVVVNMAGRARRELEEKGSNRPCPYEP